MIPEKDMPTVLDLLAGDLAVYLGDKNALVGMSGGIDSAVTLKLCEMAVGSRRLVAVMLPYGDQSTFDAVSVIMQTKAAKNITWDIKEIADAFPEPSNKLNKGNTQARVRMAMLYQFAAENDALVVGTTNRTEAEIGYYTKWGDGAVDIEPIAGLLKTEVRMAAKVLGVPQAIIDKPPSANLWDGQTDEGELGVTYEEMDQIIEDFELTGESPNPNADNVKKLIEGSDHKKKMPPSLEVRW